MNAESVAVLIFLELNQNKSIGTYNLKWNAVDQPSGLYFVKITADSFTKTQKLMLIK